MVNMKQLTTARRAQVGRCLVEGNSIRSTVRITGVAKNTIVRLLGELGCACAAYHNRVVRNVSVRRLQCDEIWRICRREGEERQRRQEGRGMGRCVDVDRD